jgi:hypothetical protein
VTYDASVLLISYKRVPTLRSILQAFTKQSFGGSFEVILWNNNSDPKIIETVDKIASSFSSSLVLRVIHSSENYYCIVRLAVSQLMRSNVMILCDDDVIPSSSYLSTFWKKRKEYGPDAIIGFRGHVFHPHSLDEESPQRFWLENENQTFYSEKDEDRQVHFLHFDNTLIPRHILQVCLLIALRLSMSVIFPPCFRFVICRT